MKKVLRTLVVGAMFVVIVLGIPLVFPVQSRAETDQSDRDKASAELDA